MCLGRDSAARALQSKSSRHAPTSSIPGITSAAKLLFRRRRHDVENAFFARLRWIRLPAAAAMEPLPFLSHVSVSQPLYWWVAWRCSRLLTVPLALRQFLLHRHAHAAAFLPLTPRHTFSATAVPLAFHTR
jgi:hypothetical protein